MASSKVASLLLRRVRRHAATLEPELARRFLTSFDVIRASLNEQELAKLIGAGAIERLTAELAKSDLVEKGFVKVTSKLTDGVAKAAQRFMLDLPSAAKNSTFNILSPRVIDAIRQLDSRVIKGVKDEIIGTFRQKIEAGILAGTPPLEIARGLRDTIGLAPNQELAVRNFQKSLEEGNRAKALGYKLRDHRYDKTVSKALGKNGAGLSTDQVKKMTDAYRRRFVAHNAATHAKSAAIDAQKLGQKLSWEDAFDKGLADPNRVTKTWLTAGDSIVREEHAAMNGEEVMFREGFSNGQDIPGDSDYNCRCIAIYNEVSASKALNVIADQKKAFEGILPGESKEQFQHRRKLERAAERKSAKKAASIKTPSFIKTPTASVPKATPKVAKGGADYLSGDFDRAIIKALDESSTAEEFATRVARMSSGNNTYAVLFDEKLPSNVLGRHNSGFNTIQLSPTTSYNLRTFVKKWKTGVRTIDPALGYVDEASVFAKEEVKALLTTVHESLHAKSSMLRGGHPDYKYILGRTVEEGLVAYRAERSVSAIIKGIDLSYFEGYSGIGSYSRETNFIKSLRQTHGDDAIETLFNSKDRRSVLRSLFTKEIQDVTGQNLSYLFDSDEALVSFSRAYRDRWRAMVVPSKVLTKDEIIKTVKSFTESFKPSTTLFNAKKSNAQFDVWVNGKAIPDPPPQFKQKMAGESIADFQLRRKKERAALRAWMKKNGVDKSDVIEYGAPKDGVSGSTSSSTKWSSQITSKEGKFVVGDIDYFEKHLSTTQDFDWVSLKEDIKFSGAPSAEKKILYSKVVKLMQEQKDLKMSLPGASTWSDDVKTVHGKVLVAKIEKIGSQKSVFNFEWYDLENQIQGSAVATKVEKKILLSKVAELKSKYLGAGKGFGTKAVTPPPPKTTPTPAPSPALKPPAAATAIPGAPKQTLHQLPGESTLEFQARRRKERAALRRWNKTHGGDITTKGAPVSTSAADQKAADRIMGNGLDKKQGPTGSNEGGYYTGKDGVRRYVKFYKEEAQARGEMLANEIYGDLKIGAPKSTVFRDPTSGRWVHATEIISDSHGTVKSLGLTAEYAEEVMKGFAADVLTANWDAVGTGLDNVIIRLRYRAGKETFEVVRIDQGGSFLMRAKAGRKADNLLNKIDEFEGFFTKNFDYKNVAGKAGFSRAEDMGEALIKQIEAIEDLASKVGGWEKYVASRLPGFVGKDRDAIVSMLKSRTKLLSAKKKVIRDYIEAKRIADEEAKRLAKNFNLSKGAHPLTDTRDSILEKSVRGFKDDMDSWSSKELGHSYSQGHSIADPYSPRESSKIVGKLVQAKHPELRAEFESLAATYNQGRAKTDPVATIIEGFSSAWNGSSAGSEKMVAMHLAILDELGLKGATTSAYGAKTLAEAQKIYKKHQKAMRAVVRAMYDQTQAFLAKNTKQKTILAFRGMGLKRASTSLDLVKEDIALRPISSYSFSPTKAISFAQSKTHGALLISIVDTSDIFSLGSVGAGTLYEPELVLLGGTVKQFIIPASQVRGKSFAEIVTWLKKKGLIK